MKKSSSQLSLFDTTAIDTSLGFGGLRLFNRVATNDDDETPPPAPPVAMVARNYRLIGDRALSGSWKQRAEDNIEAIRLAAVIEAEHRPATADEQASLAKFIGFGASDLANALFPLPGEDFREGWEDIGAQLESLVDKVERSSLARSTQYAHFTPEWMVRAMWQGVRRLGFCAGSVLEPGCGSGLFIALAPDAPAGSVTFTGIEADPVTARIARLLYPEAWIRAEDFTKAALPETYDLVIGNPPFSDRTVRGTDRIGRLGLSLHDYFIARAIDRLRPGGIGAFVVSRYTMDKQNPKARAEIAAMADLVGAVRMSEGSMRAESGTDVVVDILFFQRRADGKDAGDLVWLDVAEALPAEDGESAIAINRYFLDHPETVLGQHGRTSSQFGPIYTCFPNDGSTSASVRRRELEAGLTAAVARLPAGIHTPASGSTKLATHREREHVIQRVQVGTAADGALIKEGSYLLGENDLLLQVVDGLAQEVRVRSGRGEGGIPAKHARIIRGLIPVREAVREVLRDQEANQPWGDAQGRLRTAYATFVRNFGAINLTNVSVNTDDETGEVSETQRKPNLQPFLDDPDCWLVSSIEEYDVETGIAKRGPIFSERVLHPPVDPIITNAADALAVTLHEVGHVDLDRIAELLGRSRELVIGELGEQIFLNPALTTEQHEAWETADAYLSGRVRTKLAVAEAAAALDPRYTVNVTALQRVQPADLKPSEITARLGAPWILAEVVAAFSAQVIGIETRVIHTVEVAAWTIERERFVGHAAATSEWGTSRRHAGLLLEDALNASIPQIWDITTIDGKEVRELNTEATEAAKEKLAKIKGAFETWVWSDVDRADRLSRLYNDGYNNLVPRQFDGGHLRLPGASSVINFRPHQKRVIWRIISAGSTYIAHAVGAGKTFTMAAAVMEQKRLGLITKACLVVPGHCLAQISREFILLYPNARILVADETNFVASKRQRFLARAATGHWDCIVITESAFKFIPVPAAFERAMISDQLDIFEQMQTKLDKQDRVARKRIERAKEGLQEKFEALKSRKDDLVTIGEIGIDQLIVDEAQLFRKLTFSTNMTSLKGIDPDGSQRAWDLYVKTRFLAQTQPDRPLILSSGTPITNTLGEMFTIQRFMRPDALRERNIHEFDAWAACFGDTTTELELQPSGTYKPVTRFAQFVNVAELMAMFRDFADVVTKDQLREYLRLPAISSGGRQIVTAPASSNFKAYQRVLAERIALIEQRRGKVQPGDDILLSVITDGRHAAIDLRFVVPEAANDPDNKLNALVRSVHTVWSETSDRVYRKPDGTLYPDKGAAQMIFSDLGTQNAEATRGFSAYRWIKKSLVELGIPAEQIAFMQDFKKSAAKQKLFNEVNSGRVRILIGSTQTMGTGVNAQQRLAALHHLDVPWLPSDIEQREGRIERQGNQNEMIDIFAYATTGSVDATSWQLLERKLRFITAALSGDASIRKLEDVSSEINQFAMAKALASGDARLMQKSGIEADIARLVRLRAAHFDDQLAVRRRIASTEHAIIHATRRISEITADLAIRVPTKGDAFLIEIGGRRIEERKVAGASLLGRIRMVERTKEIGRWTLCRIGGFELKMETKLALAGLHFQQEVWLERTGFEQEIEVSADLSPLGFIARLETKIDHIDLDLTMEKPTLRDAEARLSAYRPRVEQSFPLADELAEKQAALLELDAELAATASIVNDVAPAGGVEPADARAADGEPDQEREAA